jgi:hypothetical protein
MKFAQVVEVYLKDDAKYGPYSIQALLKTGAINSQRIYAKPLSQNLKQLPVVGEQVVVFKGPSDFISGLGSGKTVFYYMSPLALQGNVNNNIIKNSTLLQGLIVGGSYGFAGAGVSNTNNASSTDEKNKEFVEVSDLSQLQPFAGDVIHEGRFGNSIRFGYTPDNADSTNKPSWSSTTPESPITIIRNGAGLSNGYNKFVIEDINKDDSSIWLGSKQTIKIQPSQKFSLGVVSVSSYEKPQIVINSERVIINSKKDSVLISGKKSVNISTKGWKADMDTIFSQLEAITDALLQLAPQLTAAANLGGPVASLTAGGPQLLSTITRVKTQLQTMKQ